MAPFSRGAEMVLSQSRQFAIYAPGKRVVFGEIPEGSMAVQPELLAITSERIQRALGNEIPAIVSDGLPINLHILEQGTPGDMIEIRSTRYSDGWKYQVAIPPVVEETRLAKALIQALLVEYAQRVGDRGANLPAWV